MMTIHHGGNIQEVADKLHISQKEVLDFSANINPLGFPSELWNVLANSMGMLENYPDPHYTALRQTLADHYEVDREDIFVGNGGTEILDEAIRALDASDALVLAPTFGEYERMFTRIKTRVHHFRLVPADNFHVDIEKMIEELKAHKEITAICLTNPNNPTGTVIPVKDMRKLVDFCNEHHRYLIVDEAFMDLTIDDHQSFIPELTAKDNVIIARSATKLFSIPGLRLGYGITKNQKLLQAISKQIETWSVNAIADQFGQQMFTAKNYLQQTRQWLTTTQPQMMAALKQIPQLTVYPSETNFILFKCDEEKLRGLLLPFGIMIRQCDDYVGLGPNYYRVAVKLPKENKLLITGLTKLLAKK